MPNREAVTDLWDVSDDEDVESSDDDGDPGPSVVEPVSVVGYGRGRGGKRVGVVLREELKRKKLLREVKAAAQGPIRLDGSDSDDDNDYGILPSTSAPRRAPDPPPSLLPAPRPPAATVALPVDAAAARFVDSMRQKIGAGCGDDNDDDGGIAVDDEDDLVVVAPPRTVSRPRPARADELGDDVDVARFMEAQGIHVDLPAAPAAPAPEEAGGGGDKITVKVVDSDNHTVPVKLGRSTQFNVLMDAFKRKAESEGWLPKGCKTLVFMDPDGEPLQATGTPEDIDLDDDEQIEVNYKQ